MTSDEAREAMRKMAGNVRMTLPCKNRYKGVMKN